MIKSRMGVAVAAVEHLLDGCGSRLLASLGASTVALTVAVAPLQAQQGAPARVPASVLERYVGDYVYPDGVMTFSVRRSGDTLFQDLPGRRNAYTPLSDTMFMLGPVFTAEFLIDQAGGATQILSDGVGIEIRLRRKGSPAPAAAAAAPVAAVHVPASVLERYVGVYEYIPGQMQRTDLRIVIRLQDGSLVREGAGPNAVLIPMSETRFRVGSTRFVVEFVVDDAGVTQILGTGFQQMLARLTSRR